MGKVIRYSEAFKRGVVSEIERGRWSGPFAASQAYGISGTTTVSRWVKQYGKAHLLSKVVRVSKRGEPSEIKKLKDRIRNLESALADLHMDSALERAFFKILCERTDTDPEEFKKKHGGKASIERKKKKRDGEG